MGFLEFFERVRFRRRVNKLEKQLRNEAFADIRLDHTCIPIRVERVAPMIARLMELIGDEYYPEARRDASYLVARALAMSREQLDYKYEDKAPLYQAAEDALRTFAAQGRVPRSNPFYHELELSRALDPNRRNSIES